MSQIDWSEAPDGYPIWLEFAPDIAYRNKMNGMWVRDSGDRYTTDRDTYWYKPGDGFYVAHKQPEWTGQGLPPVGTVCEALWSESRDEWLKTTVFGVNEHGQPIHRWEEGPGKFNYQASPLCGLTGRIYFRPIRTLEQIAAEDREKEIDAICYDIVSHYGNPKGSEHYLGLAKALHSAGYRKP